MTHYRVEIDLSSDSYKLPEQLSKALCVLIQSQIEDLREKKEDSLDPFAFSVSYKRME